MEQLQELICLMGYLWINHCHILSDAEDYFLEWVLQAPTVRVCTFSPTSSSRDDFFILDAIRIFLFVISNTPHMIFSIP